MSDGRLYWLDAVKGLGILSVVWLHMHNGYTDVLYIDQMFLKWICSFHMALFFVAAGYCYKMNANNIMHKIGGKVKRILVPYFVWGIFIGSFVEVIRVGVENWLNELESTIIQILTFQKSYSATWFLFVLFGVYIVEYIIAVVFTKLNLQENDVIIAITHICFLVGGYFIDESIGGYFKIRLICISVFVFYVGVILKKFIDNINYRKDIDIYIWLIISVVMLIAGGVLSLVNPQVNYSQGRFPNPIVSFSSAVLTIIGIFMMFVCISKLNCYKIKIMRWLEWCGQNSIMILCVHGTFNLGIRVIEKIIGLPIHTFPVVLSFVIVLSLNVLFIKMYPKKLLFLFGK